MRRVCLKPYGSFRAGRLSYRILSYLFYLSIHLSYLLIDQSNSDTCILNALLKTS